MHKLQVATVLGSILASVGTVESEGRRMKQCWILYEQKEKNPPHPKKKIQNIRQTRKIKISDQCVPVSNKTVFDEKKIQRT